VRIALFLKVVFFLCPACSDTSVARWPKFWPKWTKSRLTIEVYRKNLRLNFIKSEEKEERKF
jgi:hypothetical protein